MYRKKEINEKFRNNRAASVYVKGVEFVEDPESRSRDERRSSVLQDRSSLCPPLDPRSLRQDPLPRRERHRNSRQRRKDRKKKGARARVCVRVCVFVRERERNSTGERWALGPGERLT